MARQTFEAWIPEEFGSNVIQIINQTSAVEALGRPETMTTDTKHVPRSGAVDVETIAKGSPYGEDTAANDEVLLTARKFGKAIRIADEDLKDAPENIIAVKQQDWAVGYAKFFDNATLGTSGTENGTTVPFTSVYKALRTTNAATGYTADDNYTVTGSGGPTYDVLSATLSKVENGDWWDQGVMRILAHPAFRGAFRGVKDSQGRPIFIAGLAGTPDTLFDVPVRWSLGAKTSATASKSPAGKPLLVVVNTDLLIVGRRSGPESMVAGADTGAAFLSDEAILKMRARRGFTIGHEKAFAILEDNR
ncbi:phage major capsid protein [Parafrankia discariae]|uniref:phage major capsid protein n=1 Tax=Parafrankia discariae TaxID=365528 RepID=UPI00036FD931|nr:phage major capsid protein [Parafrankia discariae]